MDKLAKRLREDADNIEASVSDELGARIQASLAGVQPEKPAAEAERRTPLFWWTSSLTGVAAAAAVIAIVNLQQPEPAVPEATPQALVLPSIQWHAETAVLTSPLEQEIEDLRSDLERAEEAVRQDIERLF